MKRNDLIFVAGHRGLAGAAIVRRLERGGYDNIITRAHAQLDLEDVAAVSAFFERERPDIVFLAAAKVGGILANSMYPADFLYRNLMIQNNVIHAAHRFGVRKLLFLGSSCIYPRLAPQPIKEEYLLTGPLEPTNEAYALAKIAGIKLCAAYNRQHATQFLCVMPTNLYGPGDNYDLQTSHVLPALIRKFHEARVSGAGEVVIWGSGTPRREFLFADDMADACVHVMESMSAQDVGDIINVGAGTDVTITELAGIIADVVGFVGEIRYDRSKPDGTPRKLLDVERLRAAGWTARTPLRVGVKLAYAAYAEAQEKSGASPAFEAQSKE